MILDNYKKISIEEKANVWSHAIALIILLSLTPSLLQANSLDRNAILIGFSVFIVMTIFSYFSSVRYHLAYEVRDKYNWRRIDHICIYLLIGGSYTAYILRFMNTEKGLIFLAVHWLVIALGITKKIWFTGRFEIVSVLSYLFLGWMVMFIYDDITADMSAMTYRFLYLGGAAYTIGVLFYIWDSLKFNHFIWHIFVFAGTLCHFISLMYS